MPDTPAPVLRIDSASLLTLYVGRQWEALTVRILEILRDFEMTARFGLSADEQAEVDVFVKNFLFVLTQPDYVIPHAWRHRLVQFNTVISNVVAMSSTRTTDPWIPIVSRQSDNLTRLLALYSPRNTPSVEVARLFDANLQAASCWYCQAVRVYPSALAEAQAHEHLRHHLASLDVRQPHLEAASDLFFGSTYVDETLDRPVKEQVNRLMRARVAQVEVRNRANPRRIGVVSGCWDPRHSVYRNHYDMVAALQETWDVDLINLLRPTDTEERSDPRGFRNVHHVRPRSGDLPEGIPLENDYRLLLYPDVGMSEESLYLANMRLAPIQVTCYGHSVSTFGADIDYYIASEDVEDLERLSENYSERVVLLPGLGVTNTPVRYEPVAVPPAPEGIVLVNCSWYAQKVNAPLLATLRRILERTRSVHVGFRMYAGGALQLASHFVPFTRTVRAAVGADKVQVLPSLTYDHYMSLMAQGHLALEPFHFGGCNTVVDSLHLRQPIVTLEGKRWYARYGSALLRAAGLGDLVATTVDEYVDKASRLILDADWRQSVATRMAALDLDTLLYSKAYAARFKDAIEYLMTHHERLQQGGSRAPIRLASLVTP